MLAMHPTLKGNPPSGLAGKRASQFLAYCLTAWHHLNGPWRLKPFATRARKTAQIPRAGVEESAL